MTFAKWADATFGSNFINEEPITYFRMSAAWENAQQEIAEWVELQRNDVPATGAEFAAAIRMRSNAEIVRLDAAGGQSERMEG